MKSVLSINPVLILFSFLLGLNPNSPVTQSAIPNTVNTQTPQPPEKPAPANYIVYPAAHPYVELNLADKYKDAPTQLELSSQLFTRIDKEYTDFLLKQKNDPKEIQSALEDLHHFCEQAPLLMMMGSDDIDELAMNLIQRYNNKKNMNALTILALFCLSRRDITFSEWIKPKKYLPTTKSIAKYPPLLKVLFHYTKYRFYIHEPKKYPPLFQTFFKAFSNYAKTNPGTDLDFLIATEVIELRPRWSTVKHEKPQIPDNEQWRWLKLQIDGIDQLNKAWKARGRGNREFTKKNSMHIWKKEALIAQQYFEESWKLNPSVPVSATYMIQASSYTEMNNQTRLQWFERTIQACYDYTLAYDNFVNIYYGSNWSENCDLYLKFYMSYITSIRKNSFLPMYAFYKIRTCEFTGPGNYEWRYLWQNKQIQKATDTFFTNMFQQYPHGKIHQRLQLQQALYFVWSGQYKKAAKQLANIKNIEQLFYQSLPHTKNFSVLSRSLQMVQDEITACTGKFADRIRAGQTLVINNKIQAGTEIWKQIVEECTEQDLPVRRHLLNRIAYALSDIDWSTRRHRHFDETFLIPLLWDEKYKLCDWLLDHGYDINYKPLTERGSIVLTSFVNRNNIKVVQYLLNHGVNPDLTARKGKNRTSLYNAATYGRFEIAKLLLEHGADVNAVYTAKNWTPLHAAVGEKDVEMVKLLLTKKISNINMYGVLNYTPLSLACYKNSFEIATLLLDKKVDPNFSINQSYPPLYYACMHNNLKLVKLLLDKGANPSQTCGKTKTTPFIKAAEKGSAEVMELLINHNANMNITDKKGRNALYVATIYSNFPAVELLLQKGCMPDAPRYNKYWTPLKAACYNKNIKMVKLLLKYNADPEYKVKGTDSFHFAKKGSKIYKLLEEHVLKKNKKDIF